MELLGDFPSLTNQNKSGKETDITNPEDFSDYIQGMKNEQFGKSEKGLQEFYGQELPGVEYLKNKEDITLKYVHDYISEMGFSETIISRLVPIIELKDKSVLYEVQNNIQKIGKINPESVIDGIGDYIKSKMAYSLTVGMSLVQHQIYEANSEKKLGDNTFSEKLKEEFSSEKFSLSDKSFPIINEAIKNRDISTIDNEKLKSFVIQAKEDLEKQGDINWEEYLLSMLDKNIEGALLFFNDNEFDVELNPINGSVKDYLDRYKTGVCRHYSMIAQQLYTNLKEIYPVELENSELLIVVDLENMHVYNKIVYIGEDSKLYEINKDITNLILEGDMSPIFNEPENKAFYVRTEEEKLDFDMDEALKYA
ncbi:MAG: hypothetical protein GY828_02300 [Candidatus Gracilibacteria bacterium]|nr:hypothetical protein [Candidatus Gracilibacteria bacterium]